jgi:CARDB
MTRSGTLLTVIVIAALALPPSASFAQQRGRQQIPPGGRLFPSGRVLAEPFPDLVVLNLTPIPFSVKCIRPFIGQTTIGVLVKNVGKGAAVMPPTVPTLGRYWVGVWDLNTFPGVMSIAAGPPAKLDSLETKPFFVSMVLNLSPSGAAFALRARVDPANLMVESDENNNEYAEAFASTTVCK